MFTNTTSGKHMICDIKCIKNMDLLNNIENMKQVLDDLCKIHNYNVLGKLEHQFEPQGITLLYLLSESHISIHTFPEREYMALDIFTCREYDTNDVYESIYEYLVEVFQAQPSKENPAFIIDRRF